MIVEVSDELIEKLESTFPDIYKKGDLKKEFKNNPYTVIFVYLDHDEILGFIHINKIYDRIEINNIGVILEKRKCGIASSLIKKVTRCYKDCINITLEVRCDNIPAINLYKSLGFVEKATRKGYYKGVDGILMEKELM